MGAAAMLLEADAGAVRRARECTRDVAVGLPELGHDVALRPRWAQRRAGRQRRAAIRHRGQRLVVDFDQRGGILGEIARVRDHHGHRLADKGDLVLGQHERRDVGRQLRGAKSAAAGAPATAAAQMSASVSTACTPACARAARCVDAADARVGVRAAHECRLQHAGKSQVVDETARRL